MKKQLKLIIHPNDILRKKVDPVKDPLTLEVQNIIKQMADIMVKNKGVGLAGPQVAVNKRIILIETADGPLPLINPEIVTVSKKLSVEDEGCLSIPKIFGPVKRHSSIAVKAISINGEPLNFKAEGLFARVIQHEVDHLNGILFIDKIKKSPKNQKDRS